MRQKPVASIYIKIATKKDMEKVITYNYYKAENIYLKSKKLMGLWASTV